MTREEMATLVDSAAYQAEHGGFPGVAIKIRAAADELRKTCSGCKFYDTSRAALDPGECRNGDVLQWTLPDEYAPHFGPPPDFGCHRWEPKP